MGIRNAIIEDVDIIQKLVNSYADKGEMLHRSVIDIIENIRNYIVYLDNNNIIACCALHIFWYDLAEIKSLAVEKEYNGKGIGKKMVHYFIEEAKKFKLAKVFALTYKPGFFKKLNFTVIDKNELPQKIWAECVKCHKFPNCNETAVLYSLQG